MSLLVLGFDGAADVDGGQECEDEGLDRDHDRDLEDVDRRGHLHGDDYQDVRLEYEDQASGTMRMRSGPGAPCGTQLLK